MNRNSTPGRPQSPIDEAVLSQLRKDFHDDDGSLLHALIGAFADSADTFELAATLPEEVAQTTIRKRAQGLRAAAVMVGARQVASLCHQLESNPDATEEILKQLSAAIAIANGALARIAIAATPSP